MTQNFKEKSWFKFLSNKYILILMCFLIWIIFLDTYSIFEHQVLNKQIDELENNKKYYQSEISKDKENIKKLKNKDEVEKYAREKYYMKKNSEDVYIIEFEGDSIEKDLKK